MDTVEDVADRVVDVIAKRDIFDLGRASSIESFGYTEYKGESELASDAFRYISEPLVETIGRRFRMELVTAGVMSCEGAVLGLYRAEPEDVSELINWVPDGMLEIAPEPVQAFSPARRRKLEGSSMTAGKAFKEFAREFLPDWEWLRTFDSPGWG